MSRLIHRPAVQAALSGVLTAYLRLALGTTRWAHQRREQAEGVWESGGGVLVCFWHGRLLLSPACWPLQRAQPPRALISLSKDGEFIARAMARLGFPAIRGSATKPSDPAKPKGGGVAFRDSLRWIKGGGGLAVTPDGPRGPAESMAEGAPLLAKASGAPVLLVGLATRPCIRLKSWDRAVLPLPFARGAIVWDGPVRVGRHAELGGARAELRRRLSDATAQAEAALAA